MVPLVTLLWVALVTFLWIGITAGVWAMVRADRERRSSASRTPANE